MPDSLHPATATACPRVFIQGGVPVASAPSGADAGDDVMDKLLKALPAAQRVLAVGATAETLGKLYCRTNRATSWTCAGTATAAQGTGFDAVVVCDPLDRLDDAAGTLRRLRDLATAGAALVVHAANYAQWDTLERLMDGDLSAADDVRLRLSPSSAYKLLMDAGWMPTLAAACAVRTSYDRLQPGAWSLAEAAGVPRATAARRLQMDRLVIEARASFEAPDGRHEPARFSVVVPTNRDSQLKLNVERSPGLREVGANIVSVQGAGNPADAMAQSLPHCNQDWVLLCHQDVYFPSGFGAQLNRLLDGIPPDQRAGTLIGFAGMAVNAQPDGFAPAGFVIDRLNRFDHAASDRAVSIDELAIVVARDSIHRIDPALGWHLWATDLCLTAICEHKVFPRIVRLPLFHNSVTDYTLPEVFHASARTLAAKHAAFGPIPTLCGTIAAPAQAAAAPQPSAPSAATPTGDVQLDAADAEVARCIERADFDGALKTIVSSVHGTYLQPEHAHKGIAYPQFDRRMEQLAATLAGRRPHVPTSAKRGTLLIATELYDLGGHSRVLEDVSHEVEQPTVVLTDLFNRYHENRKLLAWVEKRFRHATVVVLPRSSYWGKCEMLRELALGLNPEAVFYFAHHQDPIPYVATLACEGTRKVFFHHADHNPSLGCRLAGTAHVDFTESTQERCIASLGTPARLLPIHAPDLGVKTFGTVRGLDYSIVTSGHPAKYARNGEFALGRIVEATLNTVRGNFFHIGPLPADWVAAIRAQLQGSGIDPARFVHLGLVPSVWQCLKEIDAAVYLGSAPVGGGRASIEAQGCGYPVLYFKGIEAGRLMTSYSVFAEQSLGWASVDELRGLLPSIASRHAELSAQARRFYEAGFSQQSFRQALKEICA